MVTISCAIPGRGSVFPLDIGTTRTVGHLKEKIKEQKPIMIRFDADLLRLYLAKDCDGWLNANDACIKAVKRREIPDRVKDLMQEQLLLSVTCKLNDDVCFGRNFKPAARDIHVLVEMPEDPKEVLYYKNCRKWANKVRRFACAVATITEIGCIVALCQGGNPRACMCFFFSAVVFYGAVYLLVDIKAKEYNSQIARAYSNMGFPYDQIPWAMLLRYVKVDTSALE